MKSRNVMNSNLFLIIRLDNAIIEFTNWIDSTFSPFFLSILDFFNLIIIIKNYVFL